MAHPTLTKIMDTSHTRLVQHAGVPPTPEQGIGQPFLPMSIEQPISEGIASMRTVRCYLVEDSQVIRQNLIAALEEMLPLTVVGNADTEAGAIQWMLADESDCDLMIIDIFLRAGSGLEVLRHARRLKPAARLVVLTNFATPDMRRRCLALGADRVFDKSAELEDLFGYCEELSRGD